VNIMVQRNETINQIDQQLTPILNGLLADARGEGMQAPFVVEIYQGNNGSNGKELVKFTVPETPNDGESWHFDKNVYNKLVELSSAPETGVHIHVHGSNSRPLEGGLTFEFGRTTGERAAEA
jgi:Cu/Zn superoxide dismutase